MKLVNIALLFICLIGTEAQADNRVVDAARSYVIERLDFDPNSVIVSMRDNKSLNDLLPTDSIHVYSTSNSPPRGSCSLKFDIIRDGMIIKTVSAPVKITLWADVYISKRKIKRGKSINLADLAVERHDVTSYFDKAIRVDYSFDNVRAKRSIPAGKMIVYDVIEPIPIVCRGEKVVIRCDVGKMEISTTGTAKEDGYLGETIEVINKNTRKRVSAEVEGPGVVIVRR